MQASLTSVPTKAMEQISLEIMSWSLKNVIRNGQHGLTESKTYMTNLIASYNGVTGSMNKRRAVDTVCLVFSKTFRRLFQNTIVAKLL